MHSPEDFDSLTILLALGVSVCVSVTVLCFLLWIRRGKKHKSRNGGRRKEATRPVPKKRPK